MFAETVYTPVVFVCAEKYIGPLLAQAALRPVPAPPSEFKSNSDGLIPRLNCAPIPPHNLSPTTPTPSKLFPEVP